MATDIDSVTEEDIRLSTVVNRIILAAEQSDDLRSIYWQGVILTKKECQVLAKHLMNRIRTVQKVTDSGILSMGHY
jgi:uncharacterized protein involved in tolerance to divalent cations